MSAGKTVRLKNTKARSAHFLTASGPGHGGMASILHDCGPFVQASAPLLESSPAVWYNHVSPGGSVNPGRTNRRIIEVLETLRPKTFRILEVFDVVESGKVSASRKHLKQAARVARDNDGFVLAYDWTRVITALLRRDANPNRQEWDALRDMTGGVVLATFLDPLWSATRIHRFKNPPNYKRVTARV